MKDNSYSILLNFDQILYLVKQLSESDKERLVAELDKYELKDADALNEEKIKELMRHVKPYFTDRLGKFTHKKKSDDWHFYSLAFSRSDMGYCFGINIGFFQKGIKNSFNKVGMNVLITTNKENTEQRQKYVDFFKKKLAKWINQEDKRFAYPERGDEGVELARYIDFDKLESDEEIITHFQECIDGIHELYGDIVEESEIFDKVVRAAPKWNEYIVEICQNHL